MDINLLVKLSARAWSLKILALMADGVPGRQAPLLAASGAGRTAFRASLDHLIDLSLLERNPGHGHPLRPEYRLTSDGKVAGAMAARVISLTDGEPEAVLIRKSWTLPILAATKTPIHFSQIKQVLPSVTDRALSQSLAVLNDHQWIARRVDLDQRPLRPTYHAQALGQEISQVIAAV